MERIYIILKEDIIDFPPIQSIIRILVNNGKRVIHLGSFSDQIRKNELEELGAKFIQMPPYDGKASSLKKFITQYKFRKDVYNYLNRENITSKDIIWIPQIETIYLLHNLVYKYPTILHPLEFTNPVISWKYRILSPNLNLEQVFKKAKAVVCCEYNRAHLTKGIFGLDRLPFILPNKPFIDENAIINIPSDLEASLSEYKKCTTGKKVILYQGIFLDRERKLEEFCEAINLLPDEYVLVAMGKGGQLYDKLKNKYEGEKVIFIPFIRPPFHLIVTQNAYIGVLSYFPRKDNIGTVINPLYCAPNKIYEYSKFGKPMIGNDIPGLHYLFKEFHCGECIDYPISPESIKNIIIEIDSNYNEYSKGAIDFYNSENVEESIKKIITIS